ncbi:MAG: phage tail tape measure protein [Chitinispirillales bacterium]|jgi:hypothetical protein|nr:phage tail tape measure protein [Chitinispirillales bacterium]
MAATVFSLIGRISMQGISSSLKEVEGLEGSVKKLSKEVGKLGTNLSKAGSFLTKNLTLPLAAAGAAIGALALKTGNYASELSTLHQETGLSKDALQEFAHVAKQAGGDANTLFASVTALQNKLPEITKGSGEAAKALDTLGINVTNADGTFRDMNELFPEVIKKLQGVSDVTQRNILASEIFGKRSKELASIMGLGAGEMDKLRKEAHDLGLVMGSDGLQAAENFKAGVEKLKEQISAVGLEIGTKVIPILNETFIPLLQSTLIPALKLGADAVGGLAKAFSVLPHELQTVTLGLGSIVTALGPIVLGIGSLSGVVSKAIPVLAGLATTMGAASAGATGLGAALMGLVTGVALPLAALASVAWAVTTVYNEFATLKRLKEEAEKSNAEVKQMQDLVGVSVAAKKAVEEYEKLGAAGDKAFDPKKMEELKLKHEDAVIAAKNYNMELQKGRKLTEEEITATRNKLRGIKEVSAEEKRQTEYAIAQAKQKAEEEAKLAKQRAKEAAEANKRRIAELDALVKDHAEKYLRMGKDAEWLNRREEELEVAKAMKLKASTEDIAKIRQYYDAESVRIAKEAADKVAEQQKKVAEANEQNYSKYVGKRLEMLGIEQTAVETKYAAEVDATKNSTMSQIAIHEKYAEQRIDIGRKMLTQQTKLLDLEYDAAIKAAEKEGADVAPIREAYALEWQRITQASAEMELRIQKELTAKIAEETQRRVGITQRWVDTIVSVVSSVTSKINAIYNQAYRNREMNLDRYYKEEKKRIETAAKNQIITEEQKNSQLEALDEEMDAKKLALQRKQAKTQKAMSIFSIISDTASGVMRAIKDFGVVVGGIMAGVVTALGATQLALVASQPEPFAAGGLVKGSAAGIHAQVGERNQDELIMPLDKGVEMLADKLDSRGGGETRNYQIDVHVGTMIADELSVKKFGRKIREVIISEDRRTGVAYA